MGKTLCEVFAEEARREQRSGSMIDTRMGQADHMGKWEAAVQMVRLVDELKAIIDERIGTIDPADRMRIDGVKHTFLDSLPKKCQDEVLHG
jgi:hypothetical protein